MNEEYLLIPQDQVRAIAFNIIQKQPITNLTVATIHSYYTTAYKYLIKEDMFEDDIVTFELFFYIGTRHFPRKTSGCKFASMVLSIQFTAQVKDKSVLGGKMWDYLYSLERMNITQLQKLNYKTSINQDVMSEEEADVIKMFKTVRYIQ